MLKQYLELNNEVLNEDGTFIPEKDQEAVKRYFIDEINVRTRWFHDLEEKIDYLLKNNYWDKSLFDLYTFDEIKSLFKQAYAYKFRFPTFMGAFKFYNNYALKSNDKQEILERFEDRVAVVAMFFGDGDFEEAKKYVDLMMTQQYQPATPTFTNVGKSRAGEFISCFLMECGDSLNDINMMNSTARQLSKIGGGVSVNLTKTRAKGESLMGVENVTSGVIPIMHNLDQSFRHIDQAGQRKGAAAVYLNIFHADILDFLETRKINADEDLVTPTLSTGVVIPDKFIELARENKPMYVFYPKNLFDESGYYLDEIDMDEKYEELINNPNIRKEKLDTRKLLSNIAASQIESGYPYLMYSGTANKEHQNGNIGTISFSNLCVAPYTQILTSKGYQTIGEIAGQKVDVWNGEEWSETTIMKTGTNQDMMRVKTSSGNELDSTLYHKYYVLEDTASGKRTNPPRYKEVEAKDLKIGDKLIKFDLPVIQGGKTLEFAYDNGFFTGDGTVSGGSNIIYLYHEKTSLKDSFKSVSKWHENSSIDRLTGYAKGLQSKYFVPSNEYSIESRLQWLSGYLDADGTVTNNNGSQTLQAASINREFLVEVQLMLQTLGVDSKVTMGKEAGTSMLPANDGTGEYKEFETKELHRILINGNSLHKLSELGLKCNRLEWTTRKPNRECSHFATVTSVELLEEKMDTYCFTEPKRHMGMFNGILTGQCTEIFQASIVSEYRDYDDNNDEIGLDISCNLGSLNIINVMKEKTLEETVDLSIKALNKVSEHSHVKNAPGVRKANELMRSVGLGAMNLHGYLANVGIPYESEDAREFVDFFFSAVRYYALKTSNQIAKDKGQSYYKFEGTKYATGEFFDDYIKNKYPGELIDIESDKVAELFEGIKLPTTDDWLQLKEDVKEYGLYNSYTMAIAPTGSISYVQSSTSGVMPITERVENRTYGDSRTNFPMPNLSTKNWFLYKEAYDMDMMKVIDLIATIQKHVDQGISFELFVQDTITTRDLTKLQMYAHHKGIKSLYYTRQKDTGNAMCVACAV